jgi:uncharacterized glyoxalase superfamily protein PhnB
MKTHVILYVSDQKQSTEFYKTVFDSSPVLEVPGMTEFRLGPDTVLGLMPETGASRLLGYSIGPSSPGTEPRAELYLVVDDPAEYHSRALAAGAREISPLSDRDWGHKAAYSTDLSGHVLAFAQEILG